MTVEEEQWLLSLSLQSLLGPKIDIDQLTLQGYYKKPGSMVNPLMRNLPIKGKVSEEMVRDYLGDLGITSKHLYVGILDRCLSGQGFSTNVQRLLQLGRTMNEGARKKKQSFVINGYPYLNEFFLQVMAYEFHWPKDGFTAYDVANGVMLLRLGIGLGYIEEAAQLAYLNRLFIIAQDVFEDYQSFGCDADIGRQIHCKYLKHVGGSKTMTDQTHVLRLAYYSVWQYMAKI